MSFNLKEALDGLFLKKTYKVPSDYSQYAVNMYLGKYRTFVPIVQQILCLNLPNQAHFDYLKRHIGFGWPPKVDTPKKEEGDHLEEYLMRYYECSRLDAKDYLKFIDEHEKKMLKDYFEGE